jgi:hypothetical protein
MDTLLSQLKGQGSPFTSPSTEKLLDTIHILSQAALLVAQQLQERLPVKAQPKPIEVQRPHLPTPPLTPRSSPPTAKKTPPPTPKAPVLSWVPRSPEHYSLPTPNISTTPTPTSSASTPSSSKQKQGHTKAQRKPKRKRTKTSNPAPQPITQPPPTHSAESAPVPSTALPFPPSPTTLAIPIDQPQSAAVSATATTPTPGPTQTPIPHQKRIIQYPPPHDYDVCPDPRKCKRHFREWKRAYQRELNQPYPDEVIPGRDPLHPAYPALPSKPQPESFEDPDRDPYQLPITGSGVRMDDGKWYPIRSSSPPGKPADPFLDALFRESRSPPA